MRRTFVRFNAVWAFLAVVVTGSGANAEDLLLKAQMAAVEGDHARCAELADKVRKDVPENWRAQQVFASCAALDAQAKKQALGKAGYENKVLEAIEAIEGLLGETSTLTSRQQLHFSFMAIEMRKQLARDLTDWGANAN